MALANPIRVQKPSTTLPPPPNDEQSQRPRVRSGDLCVGCIVWLPLDGADKEIKCCKRNCCGKSLGEDGYNKPVVVLKIRQRRGSSIRGDLMCYVAAITTFNDMNLKTYLSKCPHNAEFQQSLPICHVDPDSRVEHTPSWMLRLQKSTLKKQSYVSLGHIFKVPASSLYSYGFRSRRASKLRLSATSYNHLMDEMGLRNEPYEDTALLYKTARARLEALAGANSQMPIEQTKLATVTFADDEAVDHKGKKYPVTPLPFRERERGRPRTAPTSPLLPLKERRNVTFMLNDEILDKNKCRSEATSPSSFGSDSTYSDLEANMERPVRKMTIGKSYGTFNMQVAAQHSPFPFPTAPPTPQTARYHSFSPYVESGWRGMVGRFLVGVLSVGGFVGYLWGNRLFKGMIG